MTTADEEDFDYASAYEALVEFLYLAPVGIIKFRPDGVIDMANPTAAQLLMPLSTDGDLSDLYRLVSEIAPDLKEHVQRFQPVAGQIFDQMQVVIPSTGNTVMLDINKIDSNTFMAVIQNISDLTEARRLVMHKTESQRLLASVFMRINTPVVVARADGFILMANHAFQNLMGYDAKSVAGLNIDALLPPECTGVARAARSQQMLDGGSYEVTMEIVSKTGERIQVRMNSSLLRETSDKQFRVVTVVPEAADKTGLPERSVNQVEVISLAAVKAAIGADWPFLSARGMALAEQHVKRLLGPADILKRGKDDSFVIWFADGEKARNAAVLLKASQEIRRVFSTEFGKKIGSRIETLAA